MLEIKPFRWSRAENALELASEGYLTSDDKYVLWLIGSERDGVGSMVSDLTNPMEIDFDDSGRIYTPECFENPELYAGSPEELEWLKIEKFTRDFKAGKVHVNGCTPGLHELDSLPENFVTHELLDLDTTSSSELLKFSEEWGLLYSPVRFMLSDCQKKRWTDDLEAIAFTDATGYEPYLSLREIRVTAESLQRAVRNLVDDQMGRNNGDSWGRSYINAGSVNPCSLYTPDGDTTIYQHRCLTNAICNQTLALLESDDYPFNVCPVCGHVYKRMRHDRRKPKTSKLSPNAPRYCSDTCSNRARDKRKRENRKRREASAKPNPAE